MIFFCKILFLLLLIFAIITVNFLLYSSVNSILLSHDMWYRNLAYAAGAKHYTIIIPKGSANPEVDITKLRSQTMVFA